jgi:precorrin-6Y C5,15-methyltransferase (decarboxylating)
VSAPAAVVSARSADFAAPAADFAATVDPLNVVAIACAGAGRAVPLGPGLSDDLYDSDGQLTKREVRAITLAMLGPQPGELLWDVGAGSGSIAVVQATAPDALAGLPTPAAVFIGGGLTRDGLVEACLAALPSGARLVANAVTVESEAVLAGLHAKLGGELTRVAVNRAAPVGGFTGWRPMLPVTIWALVTP